MVDTAIADLHPDLQPKSAAFLRQVPNSRIIQGWRNPAYQDELHAAGISPLTGATSLHCFTIDGKPASKAFDFGLFKDDGTYITDGTDPAYAAAGKMAIALGLVWGGMFSHPDWDHVQLA